MKPQTLKRILEVSADDLEECIATQEAEGYKLLTMARHPKKEKLIAVFEPNEMMRNFLVQAQYAGLESGEFKEWQPK